MRPVLLVTATYRKPAAQGTVVVWLSSTEVIWASSLNSLPELSSFECLAFKCKPPLSTTILLIYRPPKPNASFIPEMSNLFSTFCTMSANIIALGDMNIHVNSPTCRFAAEFLQLLDCFNLALLVDVPTHTRGYTLDLVITNSSQQFSGL